MSALNGSNSSEPSPDISPTDHLTASLATTTLQAFDSKKSTKLLRRMRIYTRSQLLFLYDSPLVHPPPNMPDLKQWFGTENEAIFNKKETELSTPGSTRERRHPKRDVDEGETTSRQTFRPTLSQPSQMGNFKHQSLRASDRERDRDRDREGERDRDRDLRDKEGQERLRHLSDKYDRDRLSLPVTGVRGKEREVAPHLGTSSTSRTGMQPQASNAASRRAETREAAKKKAGEASEDWRRGAEPPRNGRDDRPEGRKERDERARSKARDNSRPRRDPSTSRRERDKEREDGREKDRLPRGERERDDYRRERDDYRRDRDRELDKDIDQDDPRRWRDDGKREERIAARRGDRPSERDRVNKTAQESGMDPTGDRRWGSGEDRDGRYKRSSARDRKSGAMNDETNDRDDRREREKEKEPAWMNAYIPSESSGGILGAGAADGELDGIQEWKKGLKEKEAKGKIHSVVQDISSVDDANHPVASEMTESHLDEIQLFKLMMKREEERKKTEQEDTMPGIQQPQQSDGVFNFHPESSKLGPLLPPSQVDSIDNRFDMPRLLKTKDLSQRTSPAIPPPSNTDSSQERAATPSTSQTYPKLTPDLAALTSEKSPVDAASTQFNPPVGSRLLAFARTSAKSPVMANNPSSAQHFDGLLAQSPDILQGQGLGKNEALQLQTGFSPFEDHPRQSYVFTEGHLLDTHRHSLISERPTNALGGVGQLESITDTNVSGYAMGKGSRFAKFFDSKGREGVAPPSKVQTLLGFPPPSSTSGPRQDQGSINGMLGNVNDQRTMDDIFAMLSNSSQVHRNALSQNTTSPNNLPYGNQSNMLLLQQQQLNQQQLHPINRAESLYESRLDDRHFVPDGMVPGLRANLPRNREIGNMYSDPVDDPIQFSVQRVTQQRNLDYHGPVPQVYNQQHGRLPQFRGGPSPHNPQHPLINAQQHRLQPGLANLGGRPPHEPGQFIGHAPAGMHGNVPSLQQQQPPFNSFNGGSNLNFGLQQIRSPIPNHHMQTTGLPHGMGVVGHAGNMDIRQGHLLGVGIGNRAVNPGFGSQPGAGNQMQVPQAIRQQQAQQLHLPHIMPHVPPQFQQQNHSGPNNQPAHDLMALLMGGPQRD